MSWARWRPLALCTTAYVQKLQHDVRMAYWSIASWPARAHTSHLSTKTSAKSNQDTFLLQWSWAVVASFWCNRLSAIACARVSSSSPSVVGQARSDHWCFKGRSSSSGKIQSLQVNTSTVEPCIPQIAQLLYESDVVPSKQNEFGSGIISNLHRLGAQVDRKKALPRCQDSDNFRTHDLPPQKTAAAQDDTVSLLATLTTSGTPTSLCKSDRAMPVRTLLLADSEGNACHSTSK